MSSPMMPSQLPAGATPEGDAVVVGSGPVRVDAFIDFLCPYCKRFELSAEPVLAGLLAGGKVRLAYHPMNFLDEASTTQYSTRAAAASGCAADQGRFLEYAHELFTHQPPEGGAGLSEREIEQLGAGAKLDEAAFAEALADGRYLDWPTYVTARATAAGVNSTPTVLVQGMAVGADARAIAAAVAQAGRA